MARASTAALDSAGISAEVIFVDDGSTDGTLALLEQLHARDPRVRVISFKRNFGQHPAMHAGIARARGSIVVTMDGDLQNQPADIPQLVAAIDDGADVASGRRVDAEDAFFLRRLPSRLINGMLSRLTGAPISDFGCAFNAYRRDAMEPVLHRDRPPEVHQGAGLQHRRDASPRSISHHRARADSSRYGMLKLIKLALHVLTGFWAQMVQWVGPILAIGGILTAVGRRRLGH